jgi:diguanylate cyclase (GGDEF)-like protein
MLLPDTPPEGARTVAASVLADLAGLKMPHAGSRAHELVTVSIGIASARADEDITSEQLITRADRALYQAKSLGRNRAEFYVQDLDPAG